MRIEAIEGELLAPEIAVLARTLRDPAARARYERLGEAVCEGDVPDEDGEALGTLLELSLQSGRIRHLYGADGEETLVKVFRRTPAGKAQSEAAREISAALRGLQGQVLNEVNVSALAPGTFRLTIDTDRCEVTLRVERGAIRVENVAVGI